LKGNYKRLLEEKIRKYDEIKRSSNLEIDDKSIEHMYHWIKYNTQWLVRDVPEVGRGVSAGIPDYPWWFGTDNGYTIQGMLTAGMHREALLTIDLVMDISRTVNKGNGKIMHEASTNGEVFNTGNLNTTPYFIHALWKAYQWTGDEQILEKYYEDVIKGIRWIESQDKNDNGYPDGHGMMEIRGLDTEMIDVAVYQALAYQAAGNFSEVSGDVELETEFREKAAQLIRRINSDWWVEEEASFADFRSSDDEFKDLVEGAILRIDTLVKDGTYKAALTSQLSEYLAPETRKSDAINGYVLHHNWVVNTPMQTGIADEDKAKKALNTARKYRTKYGMYVTGLDRRDDQESSDKWEVFSYVGAVMTLPTGVQAIAEANYGNSEESLQYLKMLENSFDYALPGSMYEVSPDFGMITQAWNIYAVSVPIVEHFFGVEPHAYRKEVLIKPSMPLEWNNAKLEALKVGNTELTYKFERHDEGQKISLNFSDKDWRVNLNEFGQPIERVTINGEPLDLDRIDLSSIEAKGIIEILF
jgi:glycogen debranching enzyme